MRAADWLVSPIERFNPSRSLVDSKYQIDFSKLDTPNWEKKKYFKPTKI